MNTFTKSALTFLAAASISGVALADSPYDDVVTAKARVEALSNTLEDMGATVDTSVDYNGATTLLQKEAVLDAKHAELQQQYNDLTATQIAE